jgi:hypothetical protein
MEVSRAMWNEFLTRIAAGRSLNLSCHPRLRTYSGPSMDVGIENQVLVPTVYLTNVRRLVLDPYCHCQSHWLGFGISRERARRFIRRTLRNSLSWASTQRSSTEQFLSTMLSGKWFLIERRVPEMRSLSHQHDASRGDNQTSTSPRGTCI